MEMFTTLGRGYMPVVVRYEAFQGDFVAIDEVECPDSHLLVDGFISDDQYEELEDECREHLKSQIAFEKHQAFIDRGAELAYERRAA